MSPSGSFLMRPYWTLDKFLVQKIFTLDSLLHMEIYIRGIAIAIVNAVDADELKVVHKSVFNVL